MTTVSIEAVHRPPVSAVIRSSILVLGLATLVTGCAGTKDARTAPDGRPGASASDGREIEQPAEMEQPAEEASQSEPAADAPKPRSLQEAVNLEVTKAAERAEQEGAAAEEHEPTRESIHYPQPPDHQWLVDDEGRKYFVDEIPKLEGAYQRLDDDRVRVGGGFTLDTVGETDDAFLVKIYQASTVEVEDHGPTPQDVAAAEKEYSAELPEANRLVFEDFGSGLPRAGQWRNGLAIADMNGDGHPDIVHGPPRRRPGGPIVFLGDGAGHWRPWDELSGPDAPYDYGDVAAPDLNGDGTPDLLMAIHLGGLIAMVQDSPGTLVRWSDGLKLLPAGATDNQRFLSRTVTSADWDGDGDPDLVALSEGPRHPKATERDSVETPEGLAIYENRGDGTWKSRLRLGVEEGLFGDSLAVGDIDGDGHPDVFSGTNALGRRELVFLSRDGWQAEPVAPDTLRPLAFVWAVDTADFDGDGLDDLALTATARQVGEWWQAIDVLLTRRGDDGLHFERVALRAGREGSMGSRPTAIAAGDFDGDGAQDLAAGSEDGRLEIFLGDGHGHFTAEAAPELDKPAPGCRTYALEAADLDGAAGDELVAGTAGERCAGGGSLRVWKSTAR